MRRKTTMGWAASIAAIGMALPMLSYAGSWQQDSHGWWYLRDDGTYPSNAWEWIDGDGDGRAECYYFDGSGYCLTNTTTPDGSSVDADGAWTVGGVVQTQSMAGNGGVSDTQEQGSGSLSYEEIMGTYQGDGQFCDIFMVEEGKLQYDGFGEKGGFLVQAGENTFVDQDDPSTTFTFSNGTLTYYGYYAVSQDGDYLPSANKKTCVLQKVNW